MDLLTLSEVIGILWSANVLYLIANLVKIMVSPVICLYNSTLIGGVYKSFGFQCTFTQKHSEEICECSDPESLCKVQCRLSVKPPVMSSV